MQHADEDTYFRNVHLFIDRVRDFAVVKGVEMIRNNLYTCFREQVMDWYTAEMTDEGKKLVKIGNNLNVWERYLIKRFLPRSVELRSETHQIRNNSYDIYFKRYAKD
jgi:hypothetical protein